MFVGLFIVLFALCAAIPVPFVAVDWVPKATSAQKFWGTLQAGAPVWAGFSLMGSLIGTAIFALLCHLVVRPHNR